MLERDLNRIIVSSFGKDTFSHKISDDAGSFTGTSKRPFDWMAVYGGVCYYGESKLLKPLKSLNFNIIEHHQIEALSKIADQSHDAENVLPIFTIGAWESRKYFYVFVLHVNLIRTLKQLGINSILKKQLQLLIDEQRYLPVEKGQINVRNLGETIVKDTWF